MPLEKLTGRDLRELLERVRTTLRPDAIVLETRRVSNGFEIVAADAEVATRLATRSAVAPLTPSPSHPGIPNADVPRIVFVGPTGAGKTTTITKLLRQAMTPGTRGAVLALDTFRVGAEAEIRTLAKLAGARVATAHEPADLPRALRSLAGAAAILVDTAGRGPGRAADARRTAELIAALRPAEVHLTVPAGVHPARARTLIHEHRPLGVTHLLVTKLDEFPEEARWFELAAELQLAMRWVTDGQDLEADLGPASDWKIGGPRARDQAEKRDEVAA